MILREFDLDLPYVGESKEDYQMNWKSKRMKFRDEIRCIASMAERYFKPIRYKTPYSWKVMVDCYADVSQVRKTFIKSEVYKVSLGFDINKYFISPPFEKKKMIYYALTEGIRKIVSEENWDSEPFETVFKKMLEENLINSYIWRKPLTSPNRYLKAEIICEHDLNEFRIIGTIKDRNGTELARKLFITEIPNEWDFHIHLGNLTWNSNDEVALLNKDGNVIDTLKVIQ
jgi:hypothetical protein